MTQNSIVRWTLALFGGVVVSIFLFWSMQKMIHADNKNIVENEIYKMIDFVQTQRQERSPEKLKELPPEPKPKKAPHKTQIATQKQEVQNPSTQLNITLPSLGALDLEGRERPKLLAPTKVTKLDSELIPMVQTKPTYPKNAKRMGVEGVVKVSLEVNEAGEVQNIEILESNPEGVFDASVRKALLRWKFRPKTVDGRAVPQTGVLTLTFKLEN